MAQHGHGWRRLTASLVIVLGTVAAACTETRRAPAGAQALLADLGRRFPALAGHLRRPAPTPAAGRVLGCGGTDDGTRHLTGCEVRDPRPGVWVGTADLSEGRRRPTLTSMTDGRVPICGGRGATCDLLDPQANVAVPAPRRADDRAEPPRGALQGEAACRREAA